MFVHVVKYYEKITSIKINLVPQEPIPIEEVFQQLKWSRAVLTSDEGANRFQVFPNKLEEKKVCSHHKLTIMQFMLFSSLFAIGEALLLLQTLGTCLIL